MWSAVERPADWQHIINSPSTRCRAFTEVLDDHRGRHVLIVAHAGVIRASIAGVLDARISVDTASLVRIQANSERPPTLLIPRIR